MDSDAERGRRLVVLVIVACLTLSVLVIFAYNIIVGSDTLPQQIVRLILTAGLCIFLYRGANWARWVASVLFALGGLFSLFAWLIIPSIRLTGLLQLVMGLVYGAIAIVLLFVPTVRAHFGVRKTEAG